MSDKPEEKKEAAAPAPEAGGGESKGISPGMFFGVIGGMVILMLGGVFAMYKFMIMPSLEKVSSQPAHSAVEGEVPAEGEKALESGRKKGGRRTWWGRWPWRRRWT